MNTRSRGSIPDGSFLRQVDQTFEGQNLRFEFHLAPPLSGPQGIPITGVPRKITFGPWMLKAFGLLAKFKGLRGTKLDVFGYTQERRTERQLITDYEAMLEEIVAKLSPENHITALGLAAIPAKIRGFGHVKERHLGSRQGGRGGPPRKRLPQPAESAGSGSGGVRVFTPSSCAGGTNPPARGMLGSGPVTGGVVCASPGAPPTLNRHDEIDDARSRLAVEQRGVALTGDAMRLADRVALFHFAQRLL